MRRSKKHVMVSHSAEQLSEVSGDSDTSQIFRVCVRLSLNFNPGILLLLCLQLLWAAFPPCSVGHAQAGTGCLISSFCGVPVLCYLRTELKRQHVGAFIMP